VLNAGRSKKQHPEAVKTRTIAGVASGIDLNAWVAQ